MLALEEQQGRVPQSIKESSTPSSSREREREREGERKKERKREGKRVIEIDRERRHYENNCLAKLHLRNAARTLSAI